MKITRREFLRMAAYATAATGMSQFDILKLRNAMAAVGGLPVIWFEGLGDSGCVVSLANYYDTVNDRGIDYVLLSDDVGIELKFSSVLMGACGQLAVDEAENVYQEADPGLPEPKPFVLVLSGAITNVDGYCIVGEDSTNGVMELIETFSRFEGRATYVLYVGSCASYGGVNAIGGNAINDPLVAPPDHNGPTSYTGTRNFNYDYDKSVYIPGCPAHPDWIVLTILHLLTYGMPPRDNYGRPTTLMDPPITIFGDTVHDHCPRKIQHDVGNFADHVGDPVKCLRKVGCRGKETYCPCPVLGWNNTDFYNGGKIAWCAAPGINHICIGCTQPFFPDVPFNRKINNITFP